VATVVNTEGAASEPSAPARSHVEGDEQPSSAVDRYLEGPYLTGDPGRYRGWLLEHGFDLQLRYVLDDFVRLRGGLGRGPANGYVGALVASIDVDTEALGGWPGGTLHAQAMNLHGEAISSTHLGTYQPVSNIEAYAFTTLAEYWYRQDFFDGLWSLKVGKQDGSVDFAASEYSASLLGASFGAYPTLPLPTYASWGLGAVLSVQPRPWLTFQTAVFDGAPNLDEPLGGTSVFSRHGARLAVAELHAHPTGLTGMNGTVRVGAWYNTQDVPQLPEEANDSSGVTYRHNRGLYCVIDQQLYQAESGQGDSGGLGVFFQGGLVPADRNEAHFYMGTGFAITGTLPGRTADVLTVGVGHASFSRPIRIMEGRTAETQLELSYRARLTGALSLQPDLQYFVSPAGDRSATGVLVAGFRLAASL
jgi:porin